MLDKKIKQVMVQTAFKKIGIFFLAFAVTLAVMSGNHDIFYGSNGGTASEQELTAPKSVEKQKKVKTESTDKAVSEEENGDDSDADSEKSGEAVKKTSKDADSEESGADVKKTSKKDDSAESEEAVAEPEESGFQYSELIPMSRELQEYTYNKCKEHGLEYELVLAIIWRESGFNVDAVHVNTNGTRDNGIMQINDVNRKWLRDNYGITNLMDPYQNIDAGTAMLGRLTSKYGAHNAMLAYQYGEGGMAQRLRQGITTSHATEKAYAQRDHYRTII